MIRRSWTLYLGLTLVLLLALSSYSNTIRGPFHLDDFHSIVFNKNIRDISNIPKYFVSTAMGSGSPQGRGGYRPLVTSSVAMNYRISGLDTWSYHALNISFHLANIVLVFMLGLLFARRLGTSPYLALLAAGIYGLHPAHTNAVSYIIARSAVICTFFYLLAFYAYARYREAGGRTRLALSALSFIAALLTKEVAVTLPIVILLYELLVIKEKGVRHYAFCGLFFIISASFTVARFLMMKQAGYGPVVTSARTMLAQPLVISRYMRLLLLPLHLNFLPMVTVPSSLMEPMFFLPFLFIIAALAAVAYISRKNGLTAFCLAWFFVALLPETFSSLRDLMVEYRVYMPSVGPVLTIIPVGAFFIGRKPAYGKVLYGTCIVVILLFSLLTFERNKVYQSDIALWRDSVDKSPRSALSNAYLGSAYLQDGRYREAAESLTAAFSFDPSMPGAFMHYNNLAVALEKTGEYYKALEAYAKALSMEPDSGVLLLNVGTLYLKMGRPDEALPYLKKAVLSDPGSVDAKVALYQAEEGLKAR